MNLRQTIQALEEIKTEQYPRGIITAIDLGVHTYCDINSNCPVAVELRKFIHESGITLQQLLEGFAASQGSSPDQVEVQLPEFDGKASIEIAGKRVEVDFTDAIRQQLGVAFDSKRHTFNQMEAHIRRAGTGLYETYLDLYHTLKNTKTLPQLAFPARDVARAGCYITSDNTNYIFLFSRYYKPQWIVSRGIRYQMHPDDVKIIEQSVHLQITISKEGKILLVLLLDKDAVKLVHYHGGNREDCWGLVHIPERWDGHLESLGILANHLIRSLATINKDSILRDHPRDMPRIEEVFDRSTKLGEEGQLEDRQQPEGGWDVGEAPDREGDTTPRRWGQRTATTGGVMTEEEEYLRRWGTGHPAMVTMCALCGAPFGTHTGFRCPDPTEGES